jgi:hypothetical protein
MSFNISTHPQIAPAAPIEIQWLNLEPNEVQTLPRKYQKIRVIAGIAWITFRGEDFTLFSGDTFLVTPSRVTAVISGLGRLPLTYEVSYL